MAENTQGPAAATREAGLRFPDGEFAVEICGPRNETVIWGPTKALLRGRWAWANLKGVSSSTSNGAFQQMPDLPGQVVRVNPRQAKARIEDPLNTPKWREVLEKAQRVWEGLPGGGKCGPAADVEHAGLTADQVKTWLYWMRRIVDGGTGVVVSRTLPTLEDLDGMPGRIRIGQHNQGAERKEQPRWRESAAGPPPVYQGD